MNYFYFGSESISGVAPCKDRVHCVRISDEDEIYSTSITTENFYIIKSYDFKTFIFEVRISDDVERVKLIRENCGLIKSHILVTDCDDKAELLYQLNADHDLNIEVHFLEHVPLEEYLCNLFTDC